MPAGRELGPGDLLGDDFVIEAGLYLTQNDRRLPSTAVAATRPRASGLLFLPQQHHRSAGRGLHPAGRGVVPGTDLHVGQKPAPASQEPCRPDSAGRPIGTRAVTGRNQPDWPTYRISVRPCSAPDGALLDFPRRRRCGADPDLRPDLDRLAIPWRYARLRSPPRAQPRLDLRVDADVPVRMLGLPGGIAHAVVSTLDGMEPVVRQIGENRAGSPWIAGRKQDLGAGKDASAVLD